MPTQAKRSNGRARKASPTQAASPAAGATNAHGETAPPGSPATSVGSDSDHFQDIRNGANAIRAAYSDGDIYDGRLTLPMMVELEALLEQPTPAQYVKHIGPTDGKPYPSTGLSSNQYQLSMMNAVLGGPHWRALTHYENDGKLCKVVVIVGNQLTKAKLTADGDLDAGEAEVLAVREGWGAVKRGSTDGDLLKGSYTNAIKRVLAEYGAAADVYRFEFDDESVGGVSAGAGQQRDPGPRQQGGVGSQRRRDECKLDELIALAKEHGLDQHTLVNIAYAHAGREAVPVEETEAVFKGLVAHVRENPAYGERLMQAIRDAEPDHGTDDETSPAANADDTTAATEVNPGTPSAATNGDRAASEVDDPAGDDEPSSAPDLGQV